MGPHEPLKCHQSTTKLLGTLVVCRVIQTCTQAAAHAFLARPEKQATLQSEHVMTFQLVASSLADILGTCMLC